MKMTPWPPKERPEWKNRTTHGIGRPARRAPRRVQTRGSSRSGWTGRDTEDDRHDCLASYYRSAATGTIRRFSCGLTIMYPIATSRDRADAPKPCNDHDHAPPIHLPVPRREQRPPPRPRGRVPPQRHEGHRSIPPSPRRRRRSPVSAGGIRLRG